MVALIYFLVIWVLGWALDAICAHLEAVTRGEITPRLDHTRCDIFRATCEQVFDT